MADEPKAETKKFKGVYWGSSVAAPGESPSDGIMRVRLWLAHLFRSLLCSVAMKNGDISFFYKKTLVYASIFFVHFPDASNEHQQTLTSTNHVHTRATIGSDGMALFLCTT